MLAWWSTAEVNLSQNISNIFHKTMNYADNFLFLAAFRLLDEHNTNAFRYWGTILFDEDGEWIEKEMTEANLFSIRMDACCAAGVVLSEV